MSAFDLTAICSVCQIPADNCGDPRCVLPCLPRDRRLHARPHHPHTRGEPR